MNPARAFALSMVALSFTASVLYFVSGDYRRGFYNLFGGLISLTVAY